MAYQAAANQRDSSLIEALLVPRLATRIALACLGLALAGVAVFWLPKPVVVYLSGASGALCLLCATAIWSMRDKADDKLNGEFATADSFARQRSAARQLRRRSMFTAMWAALCALTAAGPSLANGLNVPVFHWMILAGGLGVAEAAYAYLKAFAWEEALIAQRDREALLRKREDERQQLLARMANGEPKTRPSAGERGSLAPH